jgi:MFS superfamily sulfate permease-like transporter
MADARDTTLDRQEPTGGGVLLLVATITVTTSTLLGVLALHTAGAASTVRRVQRMVDVLLRVEADDERWCVHKLATNAVGTQYERNARDTVVE